MSNIKKYFSFVLIFVFLFSVNSFSSKVAKRNFTKGRQYFQEGKYKQCSRYLSSFLKVYKGNKYIEEIIFLKIYSHIRMGHEKSAKIYIKKFKAKFPNSINIERIKYVESFLDYEKEDYTSASIKFLDLIYTSKNPEIVKKAYAGLELSISKDLTADQLCLIEKNISKEDTLRANILYTIAKKRYQAKEFEKAQKILGFLLADFNNKAIVNKANKLLKKIINEKDSYIKIGVLLPLTGDYSAIGLNVLRGLETAIDMYNKRQSVKIRLIIRDSKANAVNVYKLTNNLIQKEKVSSIIGPLLSDCAITATAIASANNIPVISPTASSNGLDKLNSSLFLLKVNPETISSKLAKYAMDSLGLKEFAVIFPNDNFGTAMAESFRKVVEDNGCKISFYDMYEKDEKNFAKILKRIWTKKAQEIFEARALDSGKIVDSLGGLNVEIDSSFFEDSLVFLDGVFMPGYPEEVVMFAPQVPFYRIKTQMMGAMGWLDEDVITHASKSLKGVIVSAAETGNNPLLETKRMKKFRKWYKTKYGVEPDEFSVDGYNSVLFLAGGLKKISSKVSLLNALSTINEFNALGGKILIAPELHSNQSIQMKIFKDGIYQPIK